METDHRVSLASCGERERERDIACAEHLPAGQETQAAEERGRVVQDL